MGSNLPKHPKEPIDRSDHDNVKEDVIFPDEDNVVLDHNDKLEQYYVAYSTVSFQVRNLPKYELDEDTFLNCEQQRDNLHYFKMKNLIESSEADEIFIKVLDFYNEAFEINEVNPAKIKKMKINKRLVKEFVILEDQEARFLTKPLGYFNNRQFQRIFLIYEFIPRRLHDLISQERLGPLINKMRLFKNILDIVLYLHVNGIISLDISPFSIGITGTSHEAKLLTLGNSVKLTGDAVDIFRESWFDRSRFDFFTAPELYLTKPNLLRYIWSADIWSLGILSYIIFMDGYKTFYTKLDGLFSDVEHEIYSDDKNYDAEKFFEIFDMNKIENPFIKALVTSMIRMEFSDRPNIFEVADNFNKIVRFLALDEEYEVVYKKTDVLQFTKIYDHCTYDLIVNK